MQITFSQLGIEPGLLDSKSYTLLHCFKSHCNARQYKSLQYNSVIYLYPVTLNDIQGLGGSVGCTVRLETRRSRVRPHGGRQHSFVEIDREIFSTVILSLPLIQEGQLSVSGEKMCTILVNHLED